MTRLVCAVVLVASGMGARAAENKPYHVEGLTAAEVKQLEARADRGDGAAAYQLSTNFSFYAHDEKLGDKWLKRAAELKWPQAQRSMAYLIKEYNYSPNGFGADAKTAVLGLLSEAAKTQGDACQDLGSAYEEGYFGNPNLEKAREYFLHGAELGNRMCWKDVAGYLAEGKGGPRNEEQAYYWLALETRCVDPRSISGEETWEFREKVAKGLTKEQLRRQLREVDTYIAKVRRNEIRVYFPPFGGTTIDPQLSKEGLKLSDEREARHRQQLGL